MTDRPRTFLWVNRNGVPFPQIVLDDPRVGCADLPVIPGASIKLEPDDTRSLDQLAAAYPAPVVAP